MSRTASPIAAVQLSEVTVEEQDAITLHHVSLTIPESSICAILGKNGSGKSTLLRLLATLVSPKRGKTEIFGMDLQSMTSAIRRIVGFVPEEFGMFPGLKVREYLEFFASVHKLHHSQTTIEDLIRLWELSTVADQYINTISRGYRSRLALARALLHDPRLLLLDEPFYGLDIQSCQDLLVILRELRDLGKTMIIATNFPILINSLITDIVVLDNGRVQLVVPMSEIAQIIKSSRRLRCEVINDPSIAYQALLSHKSINSISIDGQNLEFLFDGDRYTQAELLGSLIDHGVRVVRLQEVWSDLEVVAQLSLNYEDVVE
ncbi:MAG: ABC transporter ATP-binding protein [Chloroflexi bacterium]|nr:ABC transporter ATP-binding protein [Chloroflexota bacterium]